MIKLINKTTNTPMWVADERVSEYLEAGHKPASDIHAKPDKEPEVEKAADKAPEPKKESKPAPKKTSKKK